MKLLVSTSLLGVLVAVAPISGQSALTPYTDTIPGTRVKWEMVPVPGGTVSVPGDSGLVSVSVPEFWMGKTEVPWEMFDVFYLKLDVPRSSRTGVDASTRPSKPYGAPDRGFGHRGWPAISLTHGAAVRFAAWLSERTGKKYAVASDAQWQRAADLAGDASDSVAWTRANSGARTHKVATSSPDLLGLHDLYGNAGEWVTGLDGTGWLRGGTFEDPPDSVTSESRTLQQPSWNQTDPQVPKSRWWLSDGPFAGFRIVRIP